MLATQKGRSKPVRISRRRSENVRNDSLRSGACPSPWRLPARSYPYLQPLHYLLRGNTHDQNDLIAAAVAGRYGNGGMRNLQKLCEEFDAGLVGGRGGGSVAESRIRSMWSINMVVALHPPCHPEEAEPFASRRIPDEGPAYVPTMAAPKAMRRGGECIGPSLSFVPLRRTKDRAQDDRGNADDGVRRSRIISAAQARRGALRLARG
jgi:hypothetical protein